ncbi:MAG: F0F1 ATP synthase subunit B [Hyphomicrobiales bacterium]|nr:F0F1 ATP synthase subunit B [Hyphomicrobiales bacterium]
MDFISEAEFWVAIAFFGFVAVVVYFRAPAMIAKALDERAARIRDELDEAQRLREEAQALLAEYQRKRRDAESEAEEIITLARHEAERYAAETRAALQETVERRLQATEAKIKLAEAQALDEVRAAAANAAIRAAETVISKGLSAKMRADLIASGIKEIKGKLN